MKLVLSLLSTLIVISAARLTLKPSPSRDITFPRHVEQHLDLAEPVELESRTMQKRPAPNPAKLRHSETRRRKVKQVSSRKNETTRVTKQERKLHTKIIRVPEPYIVHVAKPYPVYIEKPVIVEKHIPIQLLITKKEAKQH